MAWAFVMFNLIVWKCMYAFWVFEVLGSVKSKMRAKYEHLKPLLTSHLHFRSISTCIHTVTIYFILFSTNFNGFCRWACVLYLSYMNVSFGRALLFANTTGFYHDLRIAIWIATQRNHTDPLAGYKPIWNIKKIITTIIRYLFFFLPLSSVCTSQRYHFNFLNETFTTNIFVYITFFPHDYNNYTKMRNMFNVRGLFSWIVKFLWWSHVLENNVYSFRQRKFIVR